MEDRVIQVCIPHTNRDAFDYLSDINVIVGARVLVPFRKQTRLGVVIALSASASTTGKITLRKISDYIDDKPLLSAEMLRLYQWIARYYQSPLSEVIPLALPKKLRLGHMIQLPEIDYYQLALPLKTTTDLVGRRKPKQLALTNYLAAINQPVAKKTLLAAGFSQLHIKSLLAHQLLHHTMQVDLSNWQGLGHDVPLTLNDEQAYAVDTIRSHFDAYHCFLLQGVTGSGKTEVYLHLIKDLLARGRQVLVLVPEIGLTPQLLSRFSARFTEPMVVIHSNLNETERAHAWQAARIGTIKLVIGTRAAIFTPMPALGLIILDEEHDSSFKQMDGVRYFARDTALMRAYFANIPIILGSATPSLESIYNCQQKKYTRLWLNQKALVSTPLHYQVIDLRNIPIKHGLASTTVAMINTHLKRKNQVLVFINRRGFAPVLLCHQCGWMVDCSACDSHLTMHRPSKRLICHHCGLAKTIPAICQQCKSSELIPIGTGTQRIYDYLTEEFPTTAMLRIDRDEVVGRDELNKRLESINNGEVQLIVGTQMLAKGHHFPQLTLVVVVDADCGFYNQDFRAIEQLGQLLTQVAGRAGRAHYPGQVLIQTHIPDHPLLNLLLQEGYESFASTILASRKQAALPPYHYLAVIRAQDRHNDKILQLLQAIKNYLQQFPIQVLGPAPAPLARKANQHRMQLLLKSANRQQLQATLTAMRRWLTMNKQLPAIRWNIDIDPQDLT